MTRLLGALVALVLSSDVPAPAPARAEEPVVTGFTVVDRRGAVVSRIVRARTRAGGRSIAAWGVTGLDRQTLFLRTRRALHANEPPQAALDEVWLESGGRIRWSRPPGGERITVVGPGVAYRYFEGDLGTATVRCNLSRLVEEADPKVLAAIEEYRVVKRGLGEEIKDDEYPVLALISPVEGTVRFEPGSLRMLEGPPEDPAFDAVRGAVLSALEGPFDD